MHLTVGGICGERYSDIGNLAVPLVRRTHCTRRMQLAITYRAHGNMPAKIFFTG